MSIPELFIVVTGLSKGIMRFERQRNNRKKKGLIWKVSWKG
jgi:hypothetical protein